MPESESQYPARGTKLNRLFDGGNYLAAFLVGAPLVILANDIYPATPVFKGQAWTVIAPWICASISGALWLRYRSETKRSRLLTAFLLAIVAMWLTLSVLEWADGQSQNYTTFLVPVLVAMLIVKPVSLRDIRVAAAAFAWSTVAIVLVAEIHAVVTGYRGALGGLAIRIPGVNQLATPGTRWEGPFGSPNYAGPVAAYLIVYALSQRARTQGILGVIGVVMLLVSGSRSALLGVAVGVAVYFVFSPSRKLARLTRSMRVVLATGLVVAAASVAVILDPTMSGRTPIWPNYWDFWTSSPMVGVGTSAIDHQIQDGSLPPWNVHAHDLILDLLGRYGLLGFGAGCLMLAIALVITFKGARAAAPVGLALVLTFLAIGLIEVHGSWLYWSLPTTWLLIAALWAQQASSSGPCTLGGRRTEIGTEAKSLN
jgi:hypothetical protein